VIDSTYPDPLTISKLHTIRQMESWRANGLSISLDVILWASKLRAPMKVRVLVANVCTNCVILTAPLLTDDVVNDWKRAAEKQAAARAHTADFFCCLREYPAICYRAMMGSWIGVVNLYGSALSATLAALVNRVFPR